MTDTNNPMLEWFQKFGAPMMGLPGGMALGLDLADIEKKISDMKAVEAWLDMSLAMLRMNIQALEMQKNTLEAMRAVGQVPKAGA